MTSIVIPELTLHQSSSTWYKWMVIESAAVIGYIVYDDILKEWGVCHDQDSQIYGGAFTLRDLKKDLIKLYPYFTRTDEENEKLEQQKRIELADERRAQIVRQQANNTFIDHAVIQQAMVLAAPVYNNESDELRNPFGTHPQIILTAIFMINETLDQATDPKHILHQSGVLDDLRQRAEYFSQNLSKIFDIWIEQNL